MNTNYNLRHWGIFNPVECRYKVIVLGVGGLGSFICFNLAKMGISDIEIIDFDRVEEVNVGTQLYRPCDVGEYKTKALAKIIKEFCGTDVVSTNKRVVEDTNFLTPLNTIFVLTLDTLEARKLVFEKLKDINCFCLDVRAGGEEFDIQTINTSKKGNVERWKKSFDIIPVDLPCSAKSIIYTNLVVAGEVCNIIKKINNNQPYPFRLVRHMKSYIMLAGGK